MTGIDKLDQSLILELQKDARVNNVTLARKLFASERTIRNRLKNLLDRGIIHTTVMPDLDRLGFHFMGIMELQVGLGALREVGAELAKHPSVCYLVNVTGRYEFLAIILARSSKEFAELVENYISKIPGVLRTETSVALNVYKGYEHGLDTSQLVKQLQVSEYKGSNVEILHD